MKSFNSPYTEQEQYSFVQSKNPIEPENVKLSKSFIDSKPMIQGLVRSVLKIEKSGQAHLINTGLTDVEGAKQIAQNLFGFYDREKSGTIDTVKTAPILSNAYRVFNSIFKPDKDDVNSFFETLDVDKNKKVTIEDMENLCIRYLTGTTSTFYNFHETQRQA